MRNKTLFLHTQIAAVCPILGVSVGTMGQSATCTIDYDPAATPQQRTDAQTTLSNFDWSDAAYDTWDQQQHPERTTLQQQAATAVQNNNDFLALASPTNTQVLAQVQALTRQNNKIIQRLVQLD